MAKATLYKVKLVQGFNAKGRRRAGIEVQKNTTIITELTKEQLEALNEDTWFEVSEAPEGAEPTAPGDSFNDAVVPPAEEEQTPPEPYEGVSFKDLKAEATEKGLDIKGLKSRADVIAVLTAEPTAPFEEHVTDGIRYFKDGDKVVAVEDEGFEYLQDSLAGFGDTEEEALAELNKAQELAKDLDEEEVEISPDMPREDLEELAGKVGIKDASDKDKYPNNPTLIKAIEEASDKSEES